ncbi:metallophosphoesterase family protein [Flavivirga eckloniae]|uniref:Calcineurin-like phosphoesterase domain-containing protein n=1 Tax=Flavivirga eckloniae TaxID=1803846 RepID=A0A2K9PU38_9FLAO|nr:metallophosphoesterase [Flavivirga eckloniae]AUP80564.1 hypothetical protein C1H87_18335 [Flavivirga eckloniae]
MSLTRRHFLKTAGIFTISTMVIPLEGCFGAINSKIRIGLVTDSHYADREPNNTRYYRQSIEKMDEFITLMNLEKVDFVMHMGDFKDEDANKNKIDTLKYLQAIEASYSKFKGPKYHCVGNHDVDSITKEEFLNNIDNTGIPKHKSYYSFNQSGFHIVVLDANFDKQGNNHFFKEGADWQDTNIPKIQLDWLKQDLATNDLPVIVFCHHPLFEYFRAGKKYHINNYSEVQLILKNSAKVVGVFQGHVHEEKYKEHKGMHFITQLGMVDYSGLENNSFSIVEIDENSIVINGFKRANNYNFPVQ